MIPWLSRETQPHLVLSSAKYFIIRNPLSRQYLFPPNEVKGPDSEIISPYQKIHLATFPSPKVFVLAHSLSPQFLFPPDMVSRQKNRTASTLFPQTFPLPSKHVAYGHDPARYIFSTQPVQPLIHSELSPQYLFLPNGSVSQSCQTQLNTSHSLLLLTRLKYCQRPPLSFSCKIHCISLFNLPQL